MKRSAPLHALLLSLTCLSALVAVNARADIYGFIDAQGVGHFATEKLSAQYRLYMRGNATFDSSQFFPATGSTVVAPNAHFLQTPLYRYLSQHPGLKKFEVLVSQAATEFALEPALLKAVMAAESGFNPTAVSPKGAIGLMQIMPDTAERYGVVGDSKKTVQQKLSDPRTNIRLGARYLRDLLLLFPYQQELVIASYNAGEGAVRKYNNQIPPFPETRNYVQVVAQFYQLYQPASDALGRNPDQRSAQPLVTRSESGNTRSPRIHLVIPGRKNIAGAVPAVLE